MRSNRTQQKYPDTKHMRLQISQQNVPALYAYLRQCTVNRTGAQMLIHSQISLCAN